MRMNTSDKWILGVIRLARSLLTKQGLKVTYRGGNGLIWSEGADLRTFIATEAYNCTRLNVDHCAIRWPGKLETAFPTRTGGEITVLDAEVDAVLPWALDKQLGPKHLATAPVPMAPEYKSFSYCWSVAALEFVERKQKANKDLIARTHGAQV